MYYIVLQCTVLYALNLKYLKIIFIGIKNIIGISKMIQSCSPGPLPDILVTVSSQHILTKPWSRHRFPLRSFQPLRGKASVKSICIQSCPGSATRSFASSLCACAASSSLVSAWDASPVLSRVLWFPSGGYWPIRRRMTISTSCTSCLVAIRSSACCTALYSSFLSAERALAVSSAWSFTLVLELRLLVVPVFVWEVTWEAWAEWVEWNAEWEAEWE